MMSFCYRSLFKCSLEIGLVKEHNWRIKLTVFFLENRLIYIPCRITSFALSIFLSSGAKRSALANLSFLIGLFFFFSPVIRVPTPDRTELCWVWIWSMRIWMLMFCNGMFRSVWWIFFFASTEPKTEFKKKCSFPSSVSRPVSGPVESGCHF